MRKANAKLITLAILTLFAVWRPTPAHAAPCCEVWGPVAWLADTIAESSQTGAELVQWAVQAVKWTQQNAYLGNIISLFSTLNGVMENNLQTVGAVAVSSTQARTEARVRAGQGIADSRHQSNAAETTAQVAGERTPPVQQNGQLCNMIIARQAPAVLEWFTGLLEAKLSDMVAMRYRGAGADGNGPQYAADERNLRCGVTIPGAQTANPLDGYDPACVPADKEMIDADISARSIGYDRVLQMPPFTTQTRTTPSGTITIRIPAPQVTDEEYNLQLHWVAAMNYCFFAAGPRPSPPNGADLDSPEGMAQVALYDRASALESAFVSQCTHRVAYISRPYCADPAFAAVCEVGTSSCAAALEAGVEMPPDYVCRFGLSQYQAEYLSHMVCMTRQTATSATGTGENHGATMNSNTLCQLSMSRWRARLAREDANLTNAMRALQEIRRTYSGSGQNPSKTMRINVPGSVVPQPRGVEKAGANPARSTTIVARKISATAATSPQMVTP